MIDNFDQIRGLLSFTGEDEFYFLQVIQRKKDHKDSNKRLGRNNSARLVKAYYINSLERFDEYKEEIIELCKLFNARGGINLNKRSFRQVALEMMEQLAHSIKSENYNVSKLYNSVCGQVRSKDKNWIIDIDNKDEEYINKILENLAVTDPVDVSNKIIAKLETRSGYHLITVPFNMFKFKTVFPELDVHKNNPTVLYIP